MTAVTYALTELPLFNDSGSTGKNHIHSVGYSYDAGTLPLSIPTAAAEDTWAPNIKGKSMTFSIDGAYYGSNTEIGLFIDQMFTWFNVRFFPDFDVVGTKTFTDLLKGNGSSYWQVKPVTFDYDKNFENKGFITYNLKLIWAFA